MYIYTCPENDHQRQYNKKVMEHAKMIEQKRANAVLDRDLGKFDYKNVDTNFLMYFELKSQGRPKG